MEFHHNIIVVIIAIVLRNVVSASVEPGSFQTATQTTQPSHISNNFSSNNDYDSSHTTHASISHDIDYIHNNDNIAQDSTIPFNNNNNTCTIIKEHNGLSLFSLTEPAFIIQLLETQPDASSCVARCCAYRGGNGEVCNSVSFYSTPSTLVCGLLSCTPFHKCVWQEKEGYYAAKVHHPLMDNPETPITQQDNNTTTTSSAVDPVSATTTATASTTTTYVNSETTKTTTATAVAVDNVIQNNNNDYDVGKDDKNNGVIGNEGADNMSGAEDNDVINNVLENNSESYQYSNNRYNNADKTYNDNNDDNIYNNNIEPLDSLPDERANGQAYLFLGALTVVVLLLVVGVVVVRRLGASRRIRNNYRPIRDLQLGMHAPHHHLSSTASLLS